MAFIASCTKGFGGPDSFYLLAWMHDARLDAEIAGLDRWRSVPDYQIERQPDEDNAEYQGSDVLDMPHWFLIHSIIPLASCHIATAALGIPTK
jgi:hypothetical protein